MTEPTEPTPPPDPEYEFSPAQNQVFSDLAANLSFLGWFALIVLVVYHAALLGRWAVRGTPMYERFRFIYLFWPLLVVICSAYLIRASRAFGKVVETRGSDISHLMTGLRSLNEAFSWLNLLPRVWILLAVLAVLVGLVLAAVHMFGY